jgi:hypothetical protein
MDRKLTCDESEDLEKDLTINEIKKIIFSMKQYKSPGLDGIINEFYQIYWDTIKEDLYEARCFITHIKYLFQILKM